MLNQQVPIHTLLVQFLQGTAHGTSLRDSEAAFRALLNALPVISWIADSDGTILFANDAWFAYTGLTPEQNVRDWPRLVLHPDDHDRCVARWTEALQAGRPYELEVRNRRHDGVYRWFLTRAAALRGAEGSISAWVGTSTDIQEQKAAEAALRASEAHLQAELADTKLLRDISAQLTSEQNPADLYQKLLDGAIALMRSDYASMQMLYPERGSGGELRLLASRGFTPHATRFWEWVGADGRSTCGAALHAGQRVVVADVEACEFMAGTADLATCLETGIHAVQTMPLFSRAGRLVGMLSTHWRQPHEPSERHLRLLDILGRQAADLIERTQVEAALRRAVAFDDSVLTNIGEGFYTVDAQGLVTTMNPAAERLFGWTLDELRGRKMHDMTHHRHRDGTPFPAAECPGLQVLHEGRPLANHEDVFIRKDGTFFDVVYSSAPLREGGEIVGLVVVFRDVTEHQRAAGALRESEERYRSIVQTAHEGVWLIDREGRTLYVNGRMAALLGYDATEIVGHRAAEFCFHEDRWAGQEHMDANLAGAAEDFEFRFRRRDGSALSVQAATSPVRDSLGHICGALGMFADLTEQKRLEADRLALERVREEFLAGAAHDLKTPLTTIKGVAQLQQRRMSGMSAPEGGRLLAALGQIDALVNDAVAQIDALLDVARLQAGEPLTLECGPIDLVQLVRAQMANHEAAGTGHTFTLRSDLEALVGTWDRQRLERVLANLLSNAIKYSPEGGPITLSLKQDASPTGRWAVLAVQDQGIGIPPAEITRVFDRHFRASNVPGRIDGTGIGLAATKQIVEQHGGAISVASRPGRGIIFTVRLPLDAEAGGGADG